MTNYLPIFLQITSDFTKDEENKQTMSFRRCLSKWKQHCNRDRAKVCLISENPQIKRGNGFQETFGRDERGHKAITKRFHVGGVWGFGRNQKLQSPRFGLLRKMRKIGGRNGRNMWLEKTITNPPHPHIAP